jgi:hypothetical protein
MIENNAAGHVFHLQLSGSAGNTRGKDLVPTCCQGGGPGCVDWTEGLLVQI